MEVYRNSKRHFVRLITDIADSIRSLGWAPSSPAAVSWMVIEVKLDQFITLGIVPSGRSLFIRKLV